MKVVVATRSTLGHRVGGLEKYVDDQVRELSLMGYEVVLLTTLGVQEDYSEELRLQGVEVLADIVAPSTRYQSSWHVAVSARLPVLSPRVVIFHGLAGIKVPELHGSLLVTVTHGSMPLALFNSGLDGNFLRSAAGRLKTYLLDGELRALRAHHRVALSHYDARLTDVSLCRPRGATNVVGPLIEGDVAPTARDMQILFAGRLTRSKGITDLMEAWTRVPHSGFRLVLAGDGPLAREVVRSLPDDTEYVGRLGTAETREAMKRALWLFCGGTYRESFGLAAAESMSVGTPPIYRAAGALPEVVGDAGLPFARRSDLRDTLSLAVEVEDSEWSNLSQRSIARSLSFSRAQYREGWRRVLAAT